MKRFIWVVFSSSYLKILEEQGMSSSLVHRVLRLNARFQVRDLVGNLAAAVLALSCATGAAILSVPAFSNFWLFMAAYLAMYLVGAAVFVPLIGQRFVRLNAVPCAINITLRAMKHIHAVRNVNRSNIRPARLRWVQKKRRSAYKGLRLNAWKMAGFLAVAAGRPHQERDCPKYSTLSGWLVYASENLDDSECLGDALQTCDDSIRHLVNGKPWVPLSLPRVPQVSVLNRPSHWQGTMKYLSVMRAILVSLVPIAAVVVDGLLWK